jgi:formiminotetrahydrofolate cyclodeaminase
MMSSDLTTAIALARAAIEGALANVDVNLDSMEPDPTKEDDFVARMRETAANLREPF